ncbi:MAG TPA: hypothetical protein VGL70_04890 [Candidatus Binatia bacterium]
MPKIFASAAVYDRSSLAGIRTGADFFRTGIEPFRSSEIELARGA